MLFQKLSVRLSKAMSPSSGESSRGSTSATSGRKRTSSGFLSSFLKKKKCKAEGKGKAKKKTWTKDIVCLPTSPQMKQNCFSQGVEVC